MTKVTPTTDSTTIQIRNTGTPVDTTSTALHGTTHATEPTADSQSLTVSPSEERGVEYERSARLNAVGPEGSSANDAEHCSAEHRCVDK
jgi:hypothetical protein